MIIHIPTPEGRDPSPIGRIIRIWHDNKWHAAIRISDDAYFVGVTLDHNSNVLELL